MIQLIQSSRVRYVLIYCKSLTSKGEREREREEREERERRKWGSVHCNVTKKYKKLMSIFEKGSSKNYVPFQVYLNLNFHDFELWNILAVHKYTHVIFL